MRAASWTALAALAAGLAFAFAGRATDARALDMLGGLALFVAVGALLTLLPWRRWVPLEPMPGLFPRVGRGRRWCEACGTVSPPGACAACGDDPEAGRIRGNGAGRAADAARAARAAQARRAGGAGRTTRTGQGSSRGDGDGHRRARPDALAAPEAGPGSEGTGAGANATGAPGPAGGRGGRPRGAGGRK